jgi:hypothetical protein
MQALKGGGRRKAFLLPPPLDPSTLIYLPIGPALRQAVSRRCQPLRGLGLGPVNFAPGHVAAVFHRFADFPLGLSASRQAMSRHCRFGCPVLSPRPGCWFVLSEDCYFGCLWVCAAPASAERRAYPKLDAALPTVSLLSIAGPASPLLRAPVAPCMSLRTPAAPNLSLRVSVSERGNPSKAFSLLGAKRETMSHLLYEWAARSCYTAKSPKAVSPASAAQLDQPRPLGPAAPR